MDLNSPSPVSADIFSHLRIIEGMFVSLAMSRILTTLAEYIQFPKIHRPNLLHIGWLLVVTILIINWWWGLFDSSNEVSATYRYYFFSILTPLSYYFLAALLSPGNRVSSEAFYGYFLGIRGWFYAILFFSMLTDPAEVILYIEAEGGTIDLSFYLQIFLIGLIAILFLIAARTKKYAIQQAVAVGALILVMLILISNIYA